MTFSRNKYSIFRARILSDVHAISLNTKTQTPQINTLESVLSPSKDLMVRLQSILTKRRFHKGLAIHFNRRLVQTNLQYSRETVQNYSEVSLVLLNQHPVQILKTYFYSKIYFDINQSLIHTR